MRELSWRPGQSAELSVLGDAACVGPARIARILEYSGKRIRLAAELKVQSGAAVRLEWDGQLLLGQVLTSGSDGFWMEIHHILLDTGALSWQKKGWQRG
jgi:hypothetical protein